MKYPYRDCVEYRPRKEGRAPPFWTDDMPWDCYPWSEGTYFNSAPGEGGPLWGTYSKYIVPRQAVHGPDPDSELELADAPTPTEPVDKVAEVFEALRALNSEERDRLNQMITGSF